MLQFWAWPNVLIKKVELVFMAILTVSILHIWKETVFGCYKVYLKWSLLTKKLSHLKSGSQNRFILAIHLTVWSVVICTSKFKNSKKIFQKFFPLKINFRWSKVLQYSLNFVKKPVSECPVATWSTPKPSNETFIESKWKHRPLLAIDLDDISIIEPQAGTVRLNRDIQVLFQLKNISKNILKKFLKILKNF